MVQEISSTLAFCKESWRGLVNLEEASLTSADAAAMLRASRWPFEQWTREVMVLLRENKFEKVPEEAATQLQDFGVGFLTTLHAEQEFNHVRDGERQVKSGKFGPASAWHRIWGSDVLTEWDRPPVESTPLARAASKHTLPKHTFVTPRLDHECSLPYDDMAIVTEDRPTWPNQNPENVRLSALIWAGLVASGCSIEAFRASWRSLLQIPGTVTKRDDRDFPQLVLRRCTSAFLSMRVRFLHLDDHSVVVEPISTEDAFIVDTVQDWEHWKTLEICCLPPSAREWPDSATHSGLRLVHTGKTMTLLESAAHEGFRGMTRTFLLRLHTALKVKGRKESTVMKLAAQLVKSVFTEASDGYIEECLKRRGAKADDQPQTRQSATASALEKLAGVLDDEGFSEEVQQWKEAEVLAAKRRQRHLDMARMTVHGSGQTEGSASSASHTAAASSSSGGPSSSSTDPPAPAPALKEIPWNPARGFTAAEARKFAPPNSSLRKDVVRHLRWQIRAKYLSQTWSKGFNQTGFDDDEALTHVLVLAWNDYSRQAGVPVPWNFSKFRFG